MGIHSLRTARCLRNLTIKQLADEARVGSSTVWRAEHSYTINSESRKRLCQYFGMTSRELGLVSDGNEALAAEPLQPLAPNMENVAFSSPAPQGGVPLAHVLQEDTSILPHDEIEVSYEQQLGAWLALGTGGLSSLFDAGWTLDEVLNLLRVVLRGTQGMSTSMRNQLIQPGRHGIIIKHISGEERTHLYNALERSVGEAWQLFHIARPAQVLVAAQAQLHLVQQSQDLLYPTARCSLYAGLYDLIGAAFLFQGHYDSAQRAYKRAHKAAVEGADVWNMAQSLNWLAIVANNSNRYMDAIRSIEAAVQITRDETDERFVRLKAHLFADWAYNASLLQDNMLADEKLHESALLLEHLGPDEEFDQASWHQITGSCMLIRGDYKTAITHLQQSLIQLPPQWQNRQILTLIPLAEAYARKRERDASLATAEHIATMIGKIDSQMLNYRFMEFQQVLQEIFRHDQKVHAFIAHARSKQIPHK